MSNNNTPIPNVTDDEPLSATEKRTLRAIARNFEEFKTSTETNQRETGAMLQQILSQLESFRAPQEAKERGSAGTAPTVDALDEQHTDTYEQVEHPEREAQTTHNTRTEHQRTTIPLQKPVTRSPTLSERAKIATKPSTYNGDGDAIKTEEWIKSVEHYLRILKQEKTAFAVDIISQLLRGTAAHTYRQAVESGTVFHTETQLFTWIRNTFNLEGHQEAARRLLAKLRKAKALPVPELRSKIETLAQILSLNNRDKIDHFVESLPPKIKYIVEQHSIMLDIEHVPATQVYKLALKVSHQYGRNNNRNSNNNDHKDDKTKDKDKRKQDRKKHITCYTCTGKGHFASECKPGAPGYIPPEQRPKNKTKTVAAIKQTTEWNKLQQDTTTHCMDNNTPPSLCEE